MGSGSLPSTAFISCSLTFLSGQVKTPLTRAQESRAASASAQTGTEPSAPFSPSGTCCGQDRPEPQEASSGSTGHRFLYRLRAGLRGGLSPKFREGGSQALEPLISRLTH